MKENETHSCQPNTYQTGNTRPPKNHQGLIAVLLILVIFLGGIVSALSMMNIRLLRLQSQNSTSPVQFSRNTQVSASVENRHPALEVPALGLSGQEVTELCRSYYDWPRGLYISQVVPDGPADQAGLQFGDIVTELQGRQVADKSDFYYQIRELVPGQRVFVQVFRDGSRITLQLIAQ